ncbi:ABC transporter permease [Bacillus cytotoxicus]|nr:ABC transporter permease [Bacillus cytotoxicus]EMA6345326.1 ABC transporter permease [Bacillus cytotoxicus]
MILLNTMRAEFYKIKKTKIWILLFLSPILAGGVAYASGSRYPEYQHWELIYNIMITVHSMLLLPLLTGIFTAFICRYEHANGGWKQLLIQPVTKYHTYIIKFFFIFTFISIVQVLFIMSFVTAGHLLHLSGPFPLTLVIKSVVGGCIATLPLIALQLWVSTIWSSFAAPIALNVIATIPALMIANSERFGPSYPWAQPFLAMLPKEDSQLLYISMETLIFVVMGSFALLFIGGFVHFIKHSY